MTDVKRSERTLTVGGNTVEFDHPIRDTLMVDDIVLVVLDRSDLKSPGPNNVKAFDLEGNEKWSISEPEWNPSMYLSVKNEENRIVATNYNGVVYEVNLENGAVEPLHLQK